MPLDVPTQLLGFLQQGQALFEHGDRWVRVARINVSCVFTFEGGFGTFIDVPRRQKMPSLVSLNSERCVPSRTRRDAGRHFLLLGSNTVLIGSFSDVKGPRLEYNPWKWKTPTAGGQGFASRNLLVSLFNVVASRSDKSPYKEKSTLYLMGVKAKAKSVGLSF